MRKRIDFFIFTTILIVLATIGTSCDGTVRIVTEKEDGDISLLYGQPDIAEGEQKVRDSDWQPVGSPMQASIDNYRAIALQGASKSVTVSYEISPSVSISLLEIIQLELEANFNVVETEHSIEITGGERTIQKDETITFYYAPLYKVYNITVPTTVTEYTNSDGLTVIGTLQRKIEYWHPSGAYRWGHVITDSQGNEIENTTLFNPVYRGNNFPGQALSEGEPAAQPKSRIPTPEELKALDEAHDGQGTLEGE